MSNTFKNFMWTLLDGMHYPEKDPEAVFLVVCDPSMNELWAT